MVAATSRLAAAPTGRSVAVRAVHVQSRIGIGNSGNSGSAVGARGPVRNISSRLGAAVGPAQLGIAYNAAGWDDEYATTELTWLMICVHAWFDLADEDLGIKGDGFHDYGRHRSHAWLTGHHVDDDYSIQDPRDVSADRDRLAALDISLPTDVLIEVCERLLAASLAGTLPVQIAEWFGTVDGVTVTGWDAINGELDTSDSSHLFHLHLGFFRNAVHLDHTPVLRLLLGDRMDDGVFNISLGRIVHYAALAAAGTGVLTVVLLQDAQGDGILREHTTLASLLALNVEADFTNYARKVITNPTVTVVNADNWTDLDVPDQTWASAGGASNNDLVKLLVCYAPTSDAADSAIIPLAFFGFETTTDGTPLVWQPYTAGFARSAG